RAPPAARVALVCFSDPLAGALVRGQQPAAVSHRRQSRTLSDDRSRARPVLPSSAACTGRECERTFLKTACL
ncbi:MAG: hypothetical protein JW889_14915, partial [Verrucomicrobia bacterium]|nr:hypothetical protein [Verrucomicrobiota bacterium]